MNPVARLRQATRTPFLQVVKTAVATIAAWVLCTALLDSEYPIFAAIAALLVVQPSVNQSFVRGLERSAGVVLGVLLATALHLLLGDNTWIVLLVIVLAILLAWTLRLTPGSSTQIPISAMLVLSTGATTPHYAVDRIIETVIGALVALAVNALIVPPVLLQPAHLAVARLARDTASAFERIAVGLTEGRDRTGWEADLVTARTLRQAQARSDAALAAARESLTMNPRGGRHRTILERDMEIAGHLAVIVTRVIGMTRAIRDNVAPDLVEDRAIGRIATEVARIAAEVRAFAAADQRPIAEDPASPTLTAPVVVLRPNEDHWILIGSLLEDIRRVREELLGEGA
ncbi:FUSC family protein [Curtobacterium sp. MCBD17_034]|uniref:FUSC family protein n=1 Tax=unclassified Curtobacterium TaxID=257496 RepID=UPI000DA99341|nr:MULTISPECIES: aromatic acid exporter family protein [unclassified Curtobacterium]PZE73622.1 FUSC family protein [Curtobacterium sp. MCBD17_019]PZF56845.1 FUSC family protein [Curtobacterium sp. MCBD17_034]PZM33801.1 FUSC family protein [Curtobacterium sp. MCBD17_031]